MDYESILDEANDITGNERMEKYGHPRHNFQDIATLWNAYIKCKFGQNKAPNAFDNVQKALIFHSIEIAAKDVAQMMVLFKVARELTGHDRDNLVDQAGYVRNTAQIEGIE